MQTQISCASDAIFQRAARLRGVRLGLAALACAALASASCDPVLSAVRVGTTFNQPIYLTAPAGDARLFVVEKPGTIRIVANGSVLAAPFLDINTLVEDAGEGGLLGMAFSPSYASDRLFYLYYINNAGDSVLARYQANAGNPNLAVPTSAFVLLTIDQPAGLTNHKGGTIAFSPTDGALYWGLGDGGGGGDPNQLAQNMTSLLGKMLRLDVSGGPTAPYTIPADNPFVGPDGIRDEIWALGFRNPFRFSFDRANGDLWIGDVGQGAREEVDYEPATDPGGRNYGWDVQEGTRCNEPHPGQPCENPVAPVTLTFPYHEYATHVSGTCAITGGVVYRGSAPFLASGYLFTDYCTNRIFAILPTGLVDMTASIRPNSGAISGVAAFGEDGFGDVYIVSIGSGQIHKIR